MRLTMHPRSFLAALVWAGTLLLSGAWAQPVYKCGSSYSQAPCPGAQQLDVTDSRTAAQKAQTDAAAVQSAKLADQLEKERLAREKASAGKALPTASAKKKAAASGTKTSQTAAGEKASGKPKDKPPETFVAPPAVVGKTGGTSASKPATKP